MCNKGARPPYWARRGGCPKITEEKKKRTAQRKQGI